LSIERWTLARDLSESGVGRFPALSATALQAGPKKRKSFAFSAFQVSKYHQTFLKIT
jgi:hypothetical protein